MIEVTVSYFLPFSKQQDGSTLLYDALKKKDVSVQVLNMLIDNGGDVLMKVKDGRQLWSDVMDASNTQFSDVRARFAEVVLTKFSDQVSKWVFLKDEKGRPVINITDQACEDLFLKRMLFCGCFEKVDVPPIHISDTAVVLQFDYRGGELYRRVFEKHFSTNTDDKKHIVLYEAIKSLGEFIDDDDNNEQRKHDLFERW
jgi:hypothetical protein